ncbi:D-2-hydroxyacid dehydrogenase [Halorarum salinum]|uniref:D-2-hydroxyacid dehydrogenase n=1 Tax=Halorarum salinum TaxID=2743089 RepID=A0A7D5LCP7_9EURY|nr:D-2-hydroxyacid dehydrogenase [Halobaculum salinum]QLG63652.1 D-2-hydroxyacid dehydrogenase [Halobaculum salinum]
MDTDTPHIVVLDDDAHAVPAADYVEILRDGLPDATVEHARMPAEVRELVPRAEVVTGKALDAETVRAAPRLELFACTTAGVNHLPLDAFEDAGVAVTNASGVHGPNMAEHVIGWLLMFTRRLDEGLRRQRRREWRRFQSFGELEGRTVTVVGLGAIGEAIVRRLEPFGVETVGVRYSPGKGGPTDEVIGYGEAEFADALARTDVLVLACPLTGTTEGLVGAEELRTLPPDAVVVNVARGGVLDTDALVDALRWNRIHGAALDVTDPEPLPEDHPLWSMENVFLTPHAAGHTPKYWERVAGILIENLEHVEADGEHRDLRNQVV